MGFDEVWEIDRFVLVDSPLTSEVFVAGRGVWKMRLYPFGTPMSEEKDYVGVFLQV